MESDYPHLVPCKKCGSEDLSIGGACWINVWCNDCGNRGQPVSYGSRCDRYNETMDAWNEQNRIEGN